MKKHGQKPNDVTFIHLLKALNSSCDKELVRYEWLKKIINMAIAQNPLHPGWKGYFVAIAKRAVSQDQIQKDCLELFPHQSQPSVNDS